MTARELPELRECPWCGEPLPSLIVSEGSTFRWRKVEGCCTDGPEVRHDTLANDQDAAEEDSRARAIAAWNTRAAPRVSEGMVLAPTWVSMAEQLPPIGETVIGESALTGKCLPLTSLSHENDASNEMLRERFSRWHRIIKPAEAALGARGKDD